MRFHAEIGNDNLWFPQLVDVSAQRIDAKYCFQ